MKFLIFVAILGVTAVSAKSGEYVKATKVEAETKRGSRFYSPSDPAYTCKTSPPGTSFCTEPTSCNQGNKIFTCTENFENTEPTACAEPTPYCTGKPGFAKCTAFPDRYCETSSNYVCPGVGYFPDLYDCMTFYECYYDSSLKKLVPVQFKCSIGYPFSPDGKFDYKCLGSGKCVIPQCTSTIAAQWVSMNYTNYENIMAVYCLNGRPKYVYSCPPGLELNVASLSNSESPYCEVKCKKDLQRSPNVNDNTRYYECRGGYPYEVLCSRGRVFDPYTELCVTP